MSAAATAQVSRALARALSARMPAYTAAAREGREVGLWRPPLRSVDAEIFADAGTIRARARDLARNHPYARQAVRVSRLGVVGKRMRYSCRPDHRFLGIDFEEAVRWGQEFERVWEGFAHGTGFWVDAGRRLTFTQLMGLAHDTDFIDGEALLSVEWRGGAARWRTCFQAIDTDRLSNPTDRQDTEWLKGGVELDALSAPVAYWVRHSHPADVATDWSARHKWVRVPRETRWGRPVMLHTFEPARPGQTRGISQFASVIRDMKMGREYTETALQQAILQASYAAVLVSEANYREALDVLAGMAPQGRSVDEASEEEGGPFEPLHELALQNLEALRAYHDTYKVRFGGSDVPILYPGEDLKLLTPGQTGGSLGEFQNHAVRSYTAGVGIDPITTSQDYSQTTYSSSKMAIAASYRSYEERRARLVAAVGMPMVAAFLEEAVFEGGLALPKGLDVADFYDVRDALIRGTFITAGAPMLDPVKERQAQQLGLQIGVETLQSVAAEQGEDYLELLDQQAREMMDRRERGLPPLSPGPQPNALPGNGAENGAPAPGEVAGAPAEEV